MSTPGAAKTSAVKRFSRATVKKSGIERKSIRNIDNFLKVSSLNIVSKFAELVKGRRYKEAQ